MFSRAIVASRLLAKRTVTQIQHKNSSPIVLGSRLTNDISSKIALGPIHTRTYATEDSPTESTTTSTTASTTKSTPGRPKKAGRPKLPTTEKKTSGTPGRPKKTGAEATTKKPAVKKKATKKPKAKKPKAKKRVAKKQLTELQIMKQKVSQLRAVAMLDTPKLLPPNAYLVFITESIERNGTNVTGQAVNLANKYKILPQSDREHFDNIAKENRVANAKTYQDWVERHTPDQVREANNARRALTKIANGPKPEGSKLKLAIPVRQIKDTRGPKRPSTPYAVFVKERWTSGEFKGVGLTDVGKQLSAEWKLVTEADKKRYEEAYKTNSEQYHKDYNAIFTKGKRSPPIKDAAVST